MKRPSNTAPKRAGVEEEVKTNDRRGRRGQRNTHNKRNERGKLGDREMAEAAATSMLSGRDALDDALPELFKNAPPVKASKPEFKGTVTPTPPIVPPVEQEPIPSKEENAGVETPVTGTAPEQAKAPTAEPDAVTVTPEEAVPVEETPETVAPETPSAAEEATAETTHQPKKPPRPEPTPPSSGPKKRGWWSRK